MKEALHNSRKPIPLESSIVSAAVKWTNQQPRCWAFKTHGGMYGKAGIPDVIACVDGHFLAGEFKRPFPAGSPVTLIQQKTLDLVSAVIVDEIKRQIEIAYMSPGAEEAAIFDKFVELMESAGDVYDAIVFDTAPTGHTLRLLTLPEILGVWIEQLIEKRQKAMHLMKMAARYDSYLADRIKEDPILGTLTARKEKFALARDLLTDASLTGFFFVLNAEKLSILETARAVGLLVKHGISIGGIVINKVIPPEAGTFFEKRRTAQEEYLAEIDGLFPSYSRVRLPLLDSDIRGVEQLESMAVELEALEVESPLAGTVKSGSGEGP